MPELPEVETMCRCIAAAAGCRIRDVQRPRSRLQLIVIAPPFAELRRRVVGRTIAAVRRVGKRVVLELGEQHADRPHPAPLPKGEGTGRSVPKGEGTGEHAGDCIVLEPRMTGLVLLADPPDQKHLRLVLQLTGGSAEHILFWDQRGLGVVRLLSHEEFLSLYGPARLGPDAMTIPVETLRQRLTNSRRAIKVALLDQHALAGVGNLYASEILHLSGIHPATPCRRLRPAEWVKLHAAMRKVLRAAIRHQGSTLRDGTYRIARNRRGNYQVYHRVYGRAGEPCLQCGAAQIVRIVQAQRSTFYCPACQRPCSSRPRR
jgi:formamidopyrimidine-DNA glycosylase